FEPFVWRSGRVALDGWNLQHGQRAVGFSRQAEDGREYIADSDRQEIIFPEGGRSVFPEKWPHRNSDQDHGDKGRAEVRIRSARSGESGARRSIDKIKISEIEPAASGDQRSRRPSMAFIMVTSSAYSRSEPTGIPMAMRVTWTPSGLMSFER